MPGTTNVPSRRRPLLVAAACFALVAIGIGVLITVGAGGDDSGSTDTDVGRAGDTASTLATTPPNSTSAPSAATAATAAPSSTTPADTPPEATAPMTSPETTASPTSSEFVDVLTVEELPDPTPIADAATAAVDLASDAAYANVGADSLWITNVDAGSLERRSLADLTSLGSVDAVQPAFTPQVARPMYGFDSMWTVAPGAVTRIDIATMRVVAEIALSPGGATQPGGFLSDLAIGPTGVWVVLHDTDDAIVARIDPATNAIVDRFPVDGDARSIAYGAGSLWVTSTGFTPAMLRLDPANGDLLARIDLPLIPAVVVAHDDAVWTNGTIRRAGELRPVRWALARVDPATNRTVAAVEAYAEVSPTMLVSYTDLAVGGGSAWLATPDGLVQVDESSNRAVAVLDGTGEGGIAVSSDAAWFVDKLDRTLYRIPFDT